MPAYIVLKPGPHKYVAGPNNRCAQHLRELGADRPWPCSLTAGDQIHRVEQEEHAHTLGMACPARGCTWPMEKTAPDSDERGQASTGLQLVVLFNDHTHMYYPVPVTGWRIDHPSRSIVIGKGLPRTYVPLDQVRSFEIERIGGEPL